MNKRAITILGGIFLLIVILLGLLIYFRSKSNKKAAQDTTPPVTQEPAPQPEPTEPAEPAAAAVRLTDAGEPVLSPILFYQGNGISYFNSAGHLFQTDLRVENGTALLSGKKELSIDNKSNITKIIWPLAGNDFLAQFGSGNKPSWSVYQTNSAAYTDIPSQVYSLDWMPSGDKIAFVWIDGSGKATLNLGNPDTSGYQQLTDLYEPDNVIKVSPDGAHIAFYRTQTIDSTKNTINMVSIDGKTFTSLVKDGYNTGVLWSPDSRKILFNKRDPGSQNMSLWVADINSGEVRNLNINTTLDKAVWGKDSFTVYAGVPKSGGSGAALSQDTIYKINYSTGDSKQIDPGIAVDAENLFLSLDESVLFFVNGQDQALYYIPIQ